MWGTSPSRGNDEDIAADFACLLYGRFKFRKRNRSTRPELHLAPEANPGLCASCHVQAFNVEDEDGVEFRVTGHSFQATPCVDAAGIPTEGEDCVPEERTLPPRRLGLGTVGRPAAPPDAAVSE